MHPSPMHATAALVCVLVASAPAQRPIRTLPAVAHDAFGNVDGTAGPVTPPRFRAQFWFRRDNLPKGTCIRAISLRRPRTQASAAYTADLRVRLADTVLDDADLTTTMDDNLGPRARVVFDGPIRVPASAPATSPSDAIGWIELRTPFVFQGPHLLVDMDFRDLDAQGQLFVNDVGMTGGPPTLHLPASPSCGAGLGASWSAGMYSVSDTTPFPAGLPAFILLGAPRAHLPAGLSGVLGTGCSFAVDPVQVVGVRADALGHVAWSTPIALPADARYLSAQAVHLATTGPRRAATTNAVHSILGGTGAFRELISIDGVNAFPGPPSNYTAVILLR